MNALTVVTHNSLGGATDCAFVLEGFELLHRTGTLTLGQWGPEHNRRVLGWDWTSGFGETRESWKVFPGIDVVVGNPPCSFASTKSRKDHRGSDTKAASHARAFATYAGMSQPKIAAFESVQATWNQFRDFVEELHGIVRRESGLNYSMHIVLHNAAVLGGAAQRKRLWIVWVRPDVEFGLEVPVPKLVPVVSESIGDLEGLSDTWRAQPYRRPASWWSEARRNPDGYVDGHKLRAGKFNLMLADLFDEWGNEFWLQGENLTSAMKRRWSERGEDIEKMEFPESWVNDREKILARSFDFGINQPFRLPSWRPARVVTGGALGEFIHPHEPRTLTHREAARIQGFPDTWHIWGLRDVPSHGPAWGKGVPVESARWLAVWIKRSLEGDPGTMRGVPARGKNGLPVRDIFIHDSTHINRRIQTRDGRGHLKTF